MNFSKWLAEKILGMKPGDAMYHTGSDIVKMTAPITAPLVQKALGKYGAPVFGESAGQTAVQILSAAAASKTPLPRIDSDVLSEFVLQHAGLLVPPMTVSPVME